MRSRRGGSRRRNRPRTGAPWTLTVNWPPGSASSTAYSPIHRTSASGLVKYSQTRSGGASMCTVAVTGSASIISLHNALESLQAVRPELGEEVAHPGQSFRAHGIQPVPALRPDGDKPGIPQHLQVQGDRLLGDVELPGDLADRLR